MTTKPDASFPEAVFLRRPDDTGYGFLYHGEADFHHAAASFSRPVLRSFTSRPVPGQPEPEDHLKTAILTFLGHAFDRAVPVEVGAEGISRAAAAFVLQSFPNRIPGIVVIERRDGRTQARPGTEFLTHPGHPLAVVLDADAHGGEAWFFPDAPSFQSAGTSPVTAQRWLPQIVYKLYARTPSVMAGKPLTDRASGRHSVACRGLAFGRPAPLVERV